MTDHSENTKRIAKNTIFLYIRMLVMMTISLFTFKELLKLLGVEDYGIYNVVGGVVILFSFLSNAMTQANQRFLAFNLGKNDFIAFRRTFSMILNVQLIIGAIIVVLSETIGLWFINSKMNFEPDSMVKVNWIYQFSIFTFLVQILQIPYVSAIIAYERMAFFSYLSIGEAFLKLTVVLSLSLFSENRLILYGLFIFMSALLIFMIYMIMCNRLFTACRYQKFWDKSLFKQIVGFSGWNMLGGVGTVGSSQGINILFNIFCGVVVNAAMGVSNQVNSAVNSLVGNIQTAFNPQIVKSYASGDNSYFLSLIFRAVRLSFYLILIVGLPLIVFAKPILSLWLENVPEYSVQFVQFTIAYCMIDAISGPLWTANQASGKVKNYMIAVSLMVLSNIPFAYLLLKNGYSPVWVMALRVLINFAIMLFRVFYLRRTIHFPAKLFISNIVGKVFLSVFVVGLSAILLTYLIKDDSLTIQIILFALLVSLSIITGYLILLIPEERRFIIQKISYFLSNSKRKVGD